MGVVENRESGHLPASEWIKVTWLRHIVSVPRLNADSLNHLV